MRKTVQFSLAIVAIATLGAVAAVQPRAPGRFASRIAELSEAGGDFESDNLISNERSYLHVVTSLRERGVTGGAYIGVGPDQNLSYIAQVRPTIAFIVDLRRDNLLLHLLFKALFSLSGTRAEYISFLFGRPVPERLDAWRAADVTRLASYVDETQPNTTATSSLRARVDAAIRGYGVPLSPADFATIDRFHRAFIDRGLSLRFEVTGRPPRPDYYPTYRDLMLETDREGHHRNYLATEGDFQFVRALEGRDLVIPVVGDLAGPTALRAIGRLVEARGERVSTFYVSNVEFYLSEQRTLTAFHANLSRLPRTPRSVLIRSVFGGYVLPQTVHGYTSTSLVQPIDELLDGFSTGRYVNYNDLLLSR